MEALDLISLQISLEYQLDPHGLLIPFPDSTEQALYLVYHYAGGFVPYFNHFLPPEVRQQLSTLGSAQAFTSPDEVTQIITTGYQPCGGGDQIFWSGYFTQMPDPSEFKDVTREGEARVVKVGGQIISSAVSVRQNEHSHEAYVETQPAFQRQGYGRQVVAAWAYDILKSGRVGFYSYHLTNIASSALARSLGIEWYADMVAYEPF